MSDTASYKTAQTTYRMVLEQRSMLISVTSVIHGPHTDIYWHWDRQSSPLVLGIQNSDLQKKTNIRQT